MIAYGIWKKLPYLVFLPGGLLIAAGVIFYNKGMLSTYSLLAIGIILTILGSGIYFQSRSSALKDLKL